ncbi:MAG: 2-amino-4-hydroxy-6-hydroxymethyldihydropteridine diphosphokinase [Gemmatimonadota bacterium]
MFRAPVAVGLGSNVGDRLAHLRFGVARLREVLEGLRCSSVYATEPVGRTDQPGFLNACCVGYTRMLAPDLLARLGEIERAAGRLPGGPRWGPRELDLDILLYGAEIVEEPGLRIPHPRLAERAFALVPLREVAPTWRHPLRDATVEELAAQVEVADVRRTALRLGSDPPSHAPADGGGGVRG